MFEKRTRQRVRTLLEEQFTNFHALEQPVKSGKLDSLILQKVNLNRSTNERNMTRKTRSRRLRVHTTFDSGYCDICHIPYHNLGDHLQSKRHLKLIGEDGGFISIKGFDSYLALDGIDTIDVNDKNCDYSPPYLRRNKMRRTRTSSVMCDRMKEAPMSPVSDSGGHRLRSRKNINYMTPPLEEDSLTEKPEVVKEYRELRSSSRLLAKLADQMVENDEVWNSGRPKRSCNRARISADERLVADNKSYYKVEVLSSKLRSGVPPFHHHQTQTKRPDTPLIEKDEKGLIVKFRKMRNSELVRLNNEAENFLFPKKDNESSDDDDDDDDNLKNDTSSLSSGFDDRRIKMEDDESMHSTSSESKGKKKRRTHAEAFIMDNQKYYKFETPGSRLRYQGSYLSPVPMKSKNNGDYLVKIDPDCDGEDEEVDKGFQLHIDDYHFSFENVPKNEHWYQTFQRKDQGEEKYVFLNDDNYWDPLILPYQLDYIPPLNPQECINQYAQILKILTEPPSSASTSVTCSTPDPNASNSSSDPPFTHDEDSKMSATEFSSIIGDDMKKSTTTTLVKRSRRLELSLSPTSHSSKNPRKSPRQHASTLAILSSLIHQRKRKRKSESSSLPTIIEEESSSPVKSSPAKKSKIDYLAIVRNVEEELANVETFSDIDIERDDDIHIGGKCSIDDIFTMNGQSFNSNNNNNTNNNNNNNVGKVSDGVRKKVLSGGRPGRKPGKRKKNRTGWPMNRNRRVRREHVTKEDDVDESTVDSVSVNADSEGHEICEAEDLVTTDSIINKEKKNESVTETTTEMSNSENNNKNDQNNSSDVNSVVDEDNICDLNNDDRVGRNDNNSKSDELNNSSDKVLTNKVNNSDDYKNIDLQYQPIVRVQKLDKNHIDGKSETVAVAAAVPAVGKRSSSPKRTNRGQRRMPASPKSPRMLRRPRGRWYRER